jgi:SAM-dependent methyltransferase
MLLTTLVREWLASRPFPRIPEDDLVMDSDEAVAVFARAGRPADVLSGVHAFTAELACRSISAGDRVLDLGCGPASLLASIAARNPQSSFVGIDASPKMIAAGHALLRETGLRNVALRVDDMTLLSTVAPGSADVVLSSMALHHLADTRALRHCFAAIERVMAPGARLVISDFGRLGSLKSIDYFVRRAIPPNEPVLERDYRASLRAAFSRQEMAAALPARLRDRVALYATAPAPMLIVMLTPPPDPPRDILRKVSSLRSLPRARRADYRQLYFSFRLGGMPVR